MDTGVSHTSALTRATTRAKHRHERMAWMPLVIVMASQIMPRRAHARRTCTTLADGRLPELRFFP
jgi:hypothetical protein